MEKPVRVAVGRTAVGLAFVLVGQEFVLTVIDPSDTSREAIPPAALQITVVTSASTYYGPGIDLTAPIDPTSDEARVAYSALREFPIWRLPKKST